MTRNRRLRGVVLPALSGLVLVGFVGAVGVGAVAGPRHSTSTLDGRRLTTLDDPTVANLRDGSWMTQAENWLDDHVPGRQRLLEMHSTLVRDGLRQQVIKDVYVGDPRGMLLANLPPLKVSPTLLQSATTLGQQIRAVGVPAMSVYLPRREEVFADRLPSAWPRTLAASKPAFLQTLGQIGPVLDLTSTMSDPAKRDSYYWRTDHHWTPAGVFAALPAITAEAATLGVTIPADTRPYTTHDYGTFYGSFGREVTAGGVSQPDDFAIPLPDHPRARLCSRGVCNQPTFVSKYATDPQKYANKYKAFVGGDYGIQRFKNTSPQAHGRILLIKDSFGDALSMYLAERVSSLVTVDERHYSGAEFATLISRVKPDLVIMMHNQVSVIGNSKFEDDIWVNVADAARRRDATASNAQDG